MVELGAEQADANEQFARPRDRDGRHARGRRPHEPRRAPARRRATARTTAVECVANRDRGTAWVRTTLDPGDAVLYENDLPDHYP